MAVEAGLEHYLKQINESALLTAEEERQLARTISGGAVAAARFARGKMSLADKEHLEREGNEARERMIRSNLRLVVSIAKAYARRGMPLSDLIEEGNLGLLRAVEGFDPDMGARFSTYASWWIKQSIKRAMINAVQPVHIPAYMVDMISRWKKAHHRLQEALGRAPTTQEISEEMQVPERKIQIIKRAVRAFGAPTQSPSTETGASLLELLADDKTPGPEKALSDDGESTKIRSLLESLDEREATILQLRYGLADEEPKTLKEIGKCIGLTRERVRQIEHEALAKLQAALSE